MTRKLVSTCFYLGGPVASGFHAGCLNSLTSACVTVHVASLTVTSLTEPGTLSEESRAQRPNRCAGPAVSSSVSDTGNSSRGVGAPPGLAPSRLVSLLSLPALLGGVGTLACRPLVGTQKGRPGAPGAQSRASELGSEHRSGRSHSLHS